jgi:hypothetical protein
MPPRSRGEHFIRAVADCAECHGENLGGIELINDPVFAVVYSEARRRY